MNSVAVEDLEGRWGPGRKWRGLKKRHEGMFFSSISSWARGTLRPAEREAYRKVKCFVQLNSSSCYMKQEYCNSPKWTRRLALFIKTESYNGTLSTRRKAFSLTQFTFEMQKVAEVEVSCDYARCQAPCWALVRTGLRQVHAFCFLFSPSQQTGEVVILRPKL